MAYAKAKRQPQGLEPGEVAIDLDGHLVAVSVTEEWAANGAGVHLRSKARWLDADGKPQLCPSGKGVAVECSFNAPVLMLQQHPISDLRREMLLLALGEKPTSRSVAVEAGAPTTPAPADDPTFKHDPALAELPIIAVSDEVRLNGSVKHQIATVKQMREPADPAAALGL